MIQWEDFDSSIIIQEVIRFLSVIRLYLQSDKHSWSYSCGDDVNFQRPRPCFMLCYPIYLVAGTHKYSLLEWKWDQPVLLIPWYAFESQGTSYLYTKKMVSSVRGARRALTINSVHHDCVTSCKQEEELSHFRLFPWLDLLNEIMVMKLKLPISIYIPAKINFLKKWKRKRKCGLRKTTTWA